MKRKRILLIGGALAVVGVAALALMGIFNPLLSGSHKSPPCEQLPAKAQVTQAIAQHADLVGRLSGVGDGVDVTVEEPCPNQDKAFVKVSVATQEQETSARDVLGKSNGFGVPAMVEKR